MSKYFIIAFHFVHHRNFDGLDHAFCVISCFLFKSSNLFFKCGNYFYSGSSRHGNEIKRIANIHDRTVEVINDLKVSTGSSVFVSVVGKLTFYVDISAFVLLLKY